MVRDVHHGQRSVSRIQGAWIVTTPAQEQTISALSDMVADGLLTWSAAVVMYREEFGASYLQASDDGAVAACQRADKHWRKEVLLVKLPSGTFG